MARTEGTLAALTRELATLEAEIAARGATMLAGWRTRLDRPDFLPAAENLTHYLALRSGDRTALQRRLRAHGLSSLGRSEGHVMATLRAVRATAEGRDPEPESLAAQTAAHDRLDAAASALFGPQPATRRSRIMPTLSPGTALEPRIMADIVAAGADLVRINCAHDDAETWAAMAAAARRAAAEAGRRLRLYMDLAGPKIRTAGVRPKPGVRVRAGDRVFLRAAADGPDPADAAAARATCGCTLPEAVAQIEAGGAVAFDDGKIAGTVAERVEAGLWIAVERAKPGGARLKPDKGINFPGAALAVSPLTAADRAALDAAAGLADMIGYSFVQRPGDLDALHAELDARGARPGVIAKIETETAFRNLPELIVAGAGWGPFGVMIARGDLGVEIGFPRLSEVQEEILWLCEAAQVPVVWATEVLASLVKNGMAARGEFTDAAMGARAECVMLNKGPYLAEGVRVLGDVLRRAERHIDKKTPQLPRLASWEAALG